MVIIRRLLILPKLLIPFTHRIKLKMIFSKLQTDSPPESRLPPDPPYQEDGGMPVAGATLQVAGCSADNTSGLASSFKNKKKLASLILAFQ